MNERITAKQASTICGLPLRTVQYLAAKNEIPGAAKIGSRWTFGEAKLREWIESKESDGTGRETIKPARQISSRTPYSPAGVSDRVLWFRQRVGVI